MATTSLLVVVAHPDDETFGCGSLLLHAADAGVRTGVVCATRGEAGELAAGVGIPSSIAALREQELRAAADALGVDHVELLDFDDSGMTGEPAAGSLCGADVEAVAGAVGRSIEGFRPDIVVTLDGGDGHRDHRRIRDAVERAAAGTAATLYLHALPRSLMHAWVRHHRGDTDAAAYVDLPEIGTPDDELTTIIDTSAFLDRRKAAIALHRSQRSPFDGLPGDLEDAFLARDHLIRIQPPWSRGPIEHELHGLEHGGPA